MSGRREGSHAQRAFDEAVLRPPSWIRTGGYNLGPKNLVLAMIAFELCWVDAGAATASLQINLALERFMKKHSEQIQKYMAAACPETGKNRKIIRGSFALTEPLPYVGVDAGCFPAVSVSRSGKKQGAGPAGRKARPFITNMG